MTSGTSSLSFSSDRLALVEQLIALLGHQRSPESWTLRERLGEYAQSLSDADLEHFFERLRTTGSEWDYQPPDPVARALSRLVFGVLLEPGSALDGTEPLETARHRPVIFVANHLAFADANVIDRLMCEAGFADVAERLTALVGPKVFTLPLRRVASLCFGTIKLPQSQSRASGEAVMPPREVARIAADTIVAARRRMQQGDHLLIFVEGTRSRSASMQRALAAVARYLDYPGVALLPVGLAGSERLIPIGDEALHRTRVRACVGPPVDAESLRERADGKRALVMDTVGCLIARALPPAYRGVYSGQDPAFERARAIAESLVD